MVGHRVGMDGEEKEEKHPRTHAPTQGSTFIQPMGDTAAAAAVPVVLVKLQWKTVIMGYPYPVLA